MTVELREAEFGSDEYRAACALRDEILRRPLGLVLGPEDVEGEVTHFHLLALDRAAVVGCLVLSPLAEPTIKMRQVAVAPGYQRAGIGTRLVLHAEELSLSRGYSHVVLHARDTAVPFYERLGYEVVGEGFIEVTLPHRRMHKLLGSR